MGGAVAVTLRKPDGEIIRMARWTNIWPYVAHHPKFITKDPAYIDTFIQEWNAFRQDWLDNHETGNFRIHMTSCYGDWDYLAPVNYGIIVLDLQNDIILHCQGYTGIGYESAVCVMNNVGLRRGEWHQRPDQLKIEKEYENLFNQGILGKVEDWEGNPMPIESKTWAEFRDNLAKMEGYEHLMLDLSPFKVETFADNKAGFKAIRDRIQELGFPLTDEEKKLWTSFIRGAQK